MTAARAAALRNAEAVALEAIPDLPWPELRAAVVAQIGDGARIAAFFGAWRETAGLRAVAVLARPPRLLVMATILPDGWASLVAECPQAAAFEREIAEQWDVRPAGHPWLKPLRRTAGGGAGGVPPFFTVEGDEVHEVAVGPVHAGIIEPGHFRFQCHGETVLHLEIALGYQHRGVEEALRGGPDKRTLPYMETVAGDTTIGHALAHAHVMEALSGAAPPPRALALRGAALELERLANHAGDLGALAGDIGYLPAASFCGRLRGEFLNLTAHACGSRLGRGWVRPGGVLFDVAAPDGPALRARLDAATRDLGRSAALLWNTSTVRARFEETGPLTAAACRDLGVVGVPARACGIDQDARRDFPVGVYEGAAVEVATWPTGDVFARARVRLLEAQESARFVGERLAALPEGPIRRECGPPRPSALAAAIIEGWRGPICHVAATDAAGRLARYKIVDPSFHNWIGLAMAMRGQPISDFPLCNKSFNLSYCGHDL